MEDYQLFLLVDTSELILNNVQGNFVVGSAKTMMYIDSANS